MLSKGLAAAAAAVAFQAGRQFMPVPSRGASRTVRLVPVTTTQRDDGATVRHCTHVNYGRTWPTEGTKAAARRRRQMGRAA